MTLPGRLTTLTVLVLATGLALTGCGSAGKDGSARTYTRAECRQAWADEDQMLGENGNPARAGTVLADRYDELDAIAERLATTAEATDCPERLEEYRTTFGHYFDLEVAVRGHDMVDRLATAERDLRHAIRTRDYDPLPAELAAAFRTLRTDAPRAYADLEDLLAAAAHADLTAASAAEADRTLTVAARKSAAYQRCVQALAVIGEYELHEE